MKNNSMKNNYAIRLNDPYRTEIEWRLRNGEKPYANGYEPHVLAGDTYLVDNGNGIVTLEIG